VTGAEIDFREAERADLTAVIELLQHVSRFTPEASSHDKIWSLFDEQANVSGLIGATRDGRVVAFGAIIFERKIRGGLAGHVEDIVVAPDFRGQGVGARLVGRLIELAKAQGVYKISLSCQDHNLGFYEKRGFRRGGVTMSMLGFAGPTPHEPV